MLTRAQTEKVLQSVVQAVGEFAKVQKFLAEQSKNHEASLTAAENRIADLELRVSDLTNEVNELRLINN